MEITITIDGNYSGTYYVPADQVKYIGDDFVNHGSSTIYLYKNIGEGTNYPRIVMPSNQIPYYQTGYSSNYSYIHDVTNITYNNWGNYYREKELFDVVLLTIIGFTCIWRMIHK